MFVGLRKQISDLIQPSSISRWTNSLSFHATSRTQPSWIQEYSTNYPGTMMVFQVGDFAMQSNTWHASGYYFRSWGSCELRLMDFCIGLKAMDRNPSVFENYIRYQEHAFGKYPPHYEHAKFKPVKGYIQALKQLVWLPRRYHHPLVLLWMTQAKIYLTRKHIAF